MYKDEKHKQMETSKSLAPMLACLTPEEVIAASPLEKKESSLETRNKVMQPNGRDKATDRRQTAMKHIRLSNHLLAATHTMINGHTVAKANLHLTQRETHTSDLC